MAVVSAPQQTRPGGVFRYGVHCRPSWPHQALSHECRTRQVPGDESGGQGRHRPRRGRARHADAGPHQGSRHRGDPGQRHQVHRRARHAGAAPGDRGQDEARSRARVQAQPDRRHLGRQADHLQRDAGDAQPGRRGHHPGALLGLVPGDGDVRRRHAGHRELPRGDGLQADARGSRPRDHAQDQVDHHELAQQPHGRGLHATPTCAACATCC